MAHQSNCGVFTAGKWTMCSRALLPSCSNSARVDSKYPRHANFEERYRGLQWNADEAQCRTDIDNRATVPRPHSVQCGHRPPDLSQECDFDRPPKVVRVTVPRWGEDRGHRIVHPDIDGAEPCLHLGGSGINLLITSDIRGQDEGPPSGRFDLLGGGAQSCLAASHKPDIVAGDGEVGYFEDNVVAGVPVERAIRLG